jgi:hypothetical protein
VYFVVCKTIPEQECTILTTLYLAGARRARKGDLELAFPLDVPMVPSMALAVTADGEHLSCDVFSHSETIRVGSLEFITDCFSGLSLSPMGGGSDAAVMG